MSIAYKVPTLLAVHVLPARGHWKIFIDENYPKMVPQIHQSVGHLIKNGHSD
jgi:hypothetical protein